MNAVVIISANAEWRVVKELYPNLEIQQSPYGEFANLTFDPSTGSGQRLRPLTLFHGGWGKISAVATTQYVVDHFKPDLLINLGTCGGFAGRIETGTIILVERTLVYDIIEQMGDGAEAIEYYSTDIDLSWLDESVHGLPSSVHGLLVSADRDILADDIPMLIEKYDAVAADWESGAIAWVAQKNNIRVLILRGVTDLVGGDGGEAYGNIQLFHERTKTVMRELFRQLPEWLNKIS
ncbi:MAG: 5'-methylthioadenosine/S-adenosylhomocysteine nucleosidase [Anaerolineales bacterium]|nr:5'-methylthioadenosine/S-adenosylhomocysteine nucleosidase [Anaerolineales bacterium]